MSNLMLADVTIHCMVRNEWPTVVFALLSTLPGAKRAIVVDTGSTDGTRKYLEKIRDMYPDKVELHFRDDVPDSCGWAFGKYNPPNQELSDIRRWMIQQTKTEFFWIVDGDEVYRDITVRQITEYLNGWPKDKHAAYIPLLWFVKDVHTLGLYHPGSYSMTGRLFRTEGIEMAWTFPGEMHTYKGQSLDYHSGLVDRVEWIEPYMHYEMVIKPWRRRVLSTFPYEGPQPETFYRYGKMEKECKLETESTYGVSIEGNL